MKNEEHTASPWRAVGQEIHGDSRVIATVHWCSGLGEEDEANLALIAAAPDWKARCEAAEQALEGMRGFVRIAIDQAKRMKNSARLMGPREVHDDPRLAKLWVRWTYDQGKQLLDALKPARDALNPTPQGGKPDSEEG